MSIPQKCITIHMPQRTSKILQVRLTANRNAFSFLISVTSFARYTVDPRLTGSVYPKAAKWIHGYGRLSQANTHVMGSSISIDREATVAACRYSLYSPTYSPAMDQSRTVQSAEAVMRSLCCWTTSRLLTLCT